MIRRRYQPSAVVVDVVGLLENILPTWRRREFSKQTFVSFSEILKGFWESITMFTMLSKNIYFYPLIVLRP